MKRTIGTSEAAHELLNDENASWTYAGAYALAEWLEECEEDMGEEIEFDRVAIRCEFSEYGSALEAALEYDWTDRESDDDDTREASALKWLQDQTSVIEFDGGIIIQQF